MRFASTSSSIAAAGAGPALVGAVCAPAAGSHHNSAAAAAYVKRIMRLLPRSVIACLERRRLSERQDITIIRSGVEPCRRTRPDENARAVTPFVRVPTAALR